MTLKRLLSALLLLIPLIIGAQAPFDWQVGLTVNAGDSELAPYYIASNRGGTVTQQYSTLFNAAVMHNMDTTRRLSWGAGVELWAGWASSATYGLTPATLGVTHDTHPARVWIQQAWAEGKYRAVYVTLGAKRKGSVLLNDELSSGDLTRSANSRPMVGIGGGLIQFQSVPFTKDWLQISGELGYYKPCDDKWLENHYNYYNHFITTDWWYNYKNLYFRSHPGKPFVFTIGMQAACQFGGTNSTYMNGVLVNTVEQKADAEAFFKALIPNRGGSHGGDKAFYEGNHLGTWDVMLEYKFHNGAKLRGYRQSPWEDGSGIGFRNGFDGLWGLEYRAADSGWLTGAVVEYIDFTNQSGPIHWSPTDHEGTTLTTNVTGMDDYYNNYAFNGYHNRGMSIGSPMIKSPLYNTDGHLRFDHNAVRGFHAAIKGNLGSQWRYRAMGSWRKSWGSRVQPIANAITGTSLMVEATYSPAQVPGLECGAQLAMDRGDLYGNNVGGLISVTYHGNFTLGK